MKVQSMTHLCIAGVAATLIATSAAQAQTTLVIDDFSSALGGVEWNAVTVDGITTFDEITDLAPGGAIGDRHTWISGFDFQFAGVANNLSMVPDDPANGPLAGTLNFGGFDYNLEFGLDYTPGQGTSAFDLTAGGGNAFSMDVFFTDIPSAPMTIEVVTGTGAGSMSVDVLLDNLDFTPTTYLFDFDSFTGTLDFSDVQSISWSFLTVNEFGPDAVFDNFNVVATVPTPGAAALLSLAGLAATRRRRS